MYTTNPHMTLWQRGLGISVLALALFVAFTARAAAMSDVNVMQVPETVEAPAAPLGIVIVATDASGPAALAGIQRGDILLEIGGVAVDTTAMLNAQLHAAVPGDVVAVVVQHGDEVRTVEVTVGARDGLAYLGVQVVDIQVTALEAAPGQAQSVEVVTATVATEAAPSTADRAPDGEDVTAVGKAEAVFGGVGSMVAEVMVDSPAADAGLRDGDLILALDGAAMTGPDGLVGALASYAPGDTVTLTIWRGGQAGATLEELAVKLGAAPDDPARAFLGVRLMALAPTVSVQSIPSVSVYPVPGVPALPARPEAAPSYADPMLPGGSMAHSACGVMVEQHFYAAPEGAPSPMPFVGPFSFAVPPQVSTQPATPMLHESSAHPDAAATVTVVASAADVADVAARRVVVWRAGIPAIVGTPEGNIVALTPGNGALWGMTLPQTGQSMSGGHGAMLAAPVAEAPTFTMQQLPDGSVWYALPPAATSALTPVTVGTVEVVAAEEVSADTRAATIVWR